MPSISALLEKACPVGTPPHLPYPTIIRRVIRHRNPSYETPPKRLLAPTQTHTHQTQFPIYKKFSMLYTPHTNPKPPKTKEPISYPSYYYLEQNVFLISHASGDTHIVFRFSCGVWIPLNGHINTAFCLSMIFTIWGIYRTLSV